MTIQLDQRLLTVEEYHLMVKAGILSEDDPIELLNGQLIKMCPVGSNHAACVEKIDELLKYLLRNKAMVRSQNPITLGELSEPEPDIALVRKRDNYYADRHPLPKEIILVIEVADSSLERDRQAKLPLYAQAGIPEYWIVNLEQREIEVYQSPIKDQYRSRHIYLPGDDIPLPSFDFSCAVDDLLI